MNYRHKITAKLKKKAQEQLDLNIDGEPEQLGLGLEPTTFKMIVNGKEHVFTTTPQKLEMIKNHVENLAQEQGIREQIQGSTTNYKQKIQAGLKKKASPVTEDISAENYNRVLTGLESKVNYQGTDPINNAPASDTAYHEGHHDGYSQAMDDITKALTGHGWW